jgi:hypothetical protein
VNGWDLVIAFVAGQGTYWLVQKIRAAWRRGQTEGTD